MLVARGFCEIGVDKKSRPVIATQQYVARHLKVELTNGSYSNVTVVQVCLDYVQLEQALTRILDYGVHINLVGKATKCFIWDYFL